MTQLAKSGLLALATLAASGPAAAFDIDISALVRDWGGDTTVLCAGFPAALELNGATLTCGTEYAPAERTTIAIVCNRGKGVSAGSLFHADSRIATFQQDFFKVATFANDLGLQQSGLLALSETALAVPVSKEMDDLLKELGFEPTPSVFAGFTPPPTSGQSTFEAFQPFVRGTSVLSSPTMVKLGSAANFFIPPPDNTQNALPTNQVRIELCSEEGEDLNHLGEVRDDSHPKPILTSDLTAAVRIYNDQGPIGTGVLISDRLVLTAAHVEHAMASDPESNSVQFGLVVDPDWGGTAIAGSTALAPVRNGFARGLDLAVVLLKDPIPSSDATPVPILHSDSAEYIDDAEAMTAGYGDRENVQGALEFDLTTALDGVVHKDDNSIRKGNRTLRTRACPPESRIPECKHLEGLYHYVPLLQNGATMPLTACENDSGSGAFVQTEGINGRLAVSAIFAVAHRRENLDDVCAEQMLFTDITAPDTQAKLRAAIASLDPGVDVDSLFISGELRRLPRLASAGQ